MRIKSYNKQIQCFGFFSSFLVFSFIVAMLVAPIFKSSADEFDVGVNVNSVISLSLSSSSVMINAPVGGGFGSDSADATVLTNSAFGYTLAIEDADSNTSLTSAVSEDVVSSDYLGSKTSETFEANTWGFSVDGTKFYAVPKKNSPLILAKGTTATSDEGAETTITFGAKTSASLTSGTYTDRIIISAYTNGVDGEPEGVDPGSNDPEEVSDDIPEPYEEGSGPNENKLVLLTSMQDSKLHQYCEETYTPVYSLSSIDTSSTNRASTHYFSGNYTPKAVLKDKRDGTKYSVVKFPDGRCWMISNLKISDAELTSDLSDLPAGVTWTLPASNFADFTALNTKRVYIGDGSAGGYYNYYTATAGWGPSGKANMTATQSICPKGWTLPTGSSNANSDYKKLHDTGSHFGSYWLGRFNFFDYPGQVYGNITYDRPGGTGHFWTATVNSSTRVYEYQLANNYGAFLDPASEGIAGYSVRCIAR